MKSRFLVTLFIFLCSQQGFSQITSREKMVKQIFTVFHDNDLTGFIRLFPDAADTRMLMKDIMKQQSGTDSLMPEMQEFLNDITDSTLQVEYKADYEQFREKGTDKGVDWANTVYVSYVADSSLNAETNYPQLTGRIYFKSGNTDYFMAFSEVMWFREKGWYGLFINRVDRKENENKEVGEKDGF